MTDQTILSETTDGAGSPPSEKPWSRTKALTILIAAWAVLGLLTVVTLLGSVVVGGLIAEGRPDGHRLLIQMGIVGVATIVSILAVPLLWATMVRTPNDGEDYGSIDITPAVVSLPGALLPAAICIASVWWQDSKELPFTALLATMMMLSYRHLMINEQLGPLFKSHAPELWAEALCRHDRQKAREGQLHHWLGPVIVIPPVLLILLIIAKAVLGD